MYLYLIIYRLFTR